MEGGKKKTRSVADMTREELAEQLVLCYELFGRCFSLLNGRDVDVVELENTVELDCADLELYYRCRAAGGFR